MSGDGCIFTFKGGWEYYLGGTRVTKEEYEAVHPPRKWEPGPARTQGTTTWPLESQALAVHPEQVHEANERAKRHGIAAEYREDGTCVIADATARRRLLKLEGLVDKDGFC